MRDQMIRDPEGRYVVLSLGDTLSFTEDLPRFSQRWRAARAILEHGRYGVSIYATVEEGNEHVIEYHSVSLWIGGQTRQRRRLRRWATRLRYRRQRCSG